MKDILITSSILIPAVFLLRFLFRRTVSRRVQYALWLLVLLRLLIPANLPAMGLSILTAAEPVRDSLSAAAERQAYREPYASYPVEAYSQQELPAPRPGAILVEGEGSYGVVDETGENVVFYRRRSLPILRLIWYCGMGVMALLFLGENLRFAKKLRRTRVPLAGAESRYPVYLCDDIPSPCLFGVWKPAIYVTIPAAKDPATLGHVIAHEETHARHLDPLWSLLRGLCLVVWWFDPLVWLAAHFSKADCEMACDEGVLARMDREERIAYGETLLKLIPPGRGGNPMLSATTMTAGKRQMKDRLRRIAEHRKPLFIALGAALLLAAVVCIVTFTGPKGPDKAEKEPSDSPHPVSGVYVRPEAYLDSLRRDNKEVTCVAADGGEMTVPVLDTRVHLEKTGELSGLAPEGTLELYGYVLEVKPDAEPGSIALAGGMTMEDDGWYDLEGQGGHSLVMLRYPDGSVTPLHDRPNDDDMGGLFYYEETPEDLLYDWYVRTYRLDLPPYTLDLLPQDEGGNYPAHLREGDGWRIYIPIQGWDEETDGEGRTRWVSQYGTGSSISIREASREELTAERPMLEPGQAVRYVEGEDGRIWCVFTQYAPENITDAPEIDHEPRLLAAMAASFTVPGGREAFSSIGESESHQPLSLEEQLCAAADRIFGTYGFQAGPCRLWVEADGRRDEYEIQPGQVWSVLDSAGYLLTSYYYRWSPLTEAEIEAVDRDPVNGPVLEIRNETDCFTVYGGSDVLLWTELPGGAEHWLRPEAGQDFSPTLYAYFLNEYARIAEMYRPEREIAVPGTVTDYEEVALRMAAQYAEILLERPGWYDPEPYDAAVNSAALFDAYYGEDYPNFCFVMWIDLKLDESNRLSFEAGSGLGDPIGDGPHKGWYGLGSEVTTALEDGVWRFKGMGSGGATVWLPYGVGYGFPTEHDLTAEQLMELYFLTGGQSRDWRVMHALALKPAEEVLQAMEKISEEQRQALLDNMERYNGEYGAAEDDWYGSFDPQAYGISGEAPGIALLKELSEYTLADWDRLSQDGRLENLYESLRKDAVGDGQTRRDVYVMTAALHSDGAYTEFLAAVLREQYAADPGAWKEALSAFSREDAGLLLQLADPAEEGDAP